MFYLVFFLLPLLVICNVEKNFVCDHIKYFEDDIICKTDYKSFCNFPMFKPSSIECVLNTEYSIWDCDAKEGWIDGVFIECTDPCVEQCHAYHDPIFAIWTLIMTLLGVTFLVVTICVLLCCAYSTHCFYTVQTDSLPPLERGVRIGGFIVKATPESGKIVKKQ